MHCFRVSNNKIGVESATAFAKALELNASLTELRVGGNSLRDESAESLAQALQESTACKLQTLEIWGNEIGTRGGKALTAYVAVSSSLTKVCTAAFS